MSHTVVLDEAERDRRMVNHLNEILRHCRVGRVVAKPRDPIMPLKQICDWKAPLNDDWFRRRFEKSSPSPAA